jgi:hypothetical protein
MLIILLFINKMRFITRFTTILEDTYLVMKVGFWLNKIKTAIHFFSTHLIIIDNQLLNRYEPTCKRCRKGQI